MRRNFFFFSFQGLLLLLLRSSLFAPSLFALVRPNVVGGALMNLALKGSLNFWVGSPSTHTTYILVYLCVCNVCMCILLRIILLFGSWHRNIKSVYIQGRRRSKEMRTRSCRSRPSVYSFFPLPSVSKVKQVRERKKRLSQRFSTCFHFFRPTERVRWQQQKRR